MPDTPSFVRRPSPTATTTRLIPTLRCILVALSSASLLAGCGGGGDGGTPQVKPATVATVRVAPSAAALDVGATVQLNATATDATGTVIAGKTVTWTSTTPSVATVTTTGLVSGLAAGTVAVTAMIDGVVGSSTITVSIPVSQVCDATQTITIGQSVSGTIASTDCQLADGAYADKYLLTLADATPVRITEIGTIDAYLILQNATTGAVVAVNDDGNGNTNARIEQIVPAGRYVITATTFGAADFGAYTLSVSRGATACITSTPAFLSDTIVGALRAATACVLPDSSYTDRYGLTLTASTILSTAMHSDSVDSFLFIESAEGKSISRTDRGGPGKDALLIDTVPAGKYIVYANAKPKEVGPYTLTFLGRIDQCAVSRSIAVGGIVTDTLKAVSCKLADGSYVKRYAFSVAATTPVRIDLSSTQFDPYLFLQRAGSATKIAEDDDSGTGLNAQILEVLPAGEYVITATSATAGETGVFTLAVSGIPQGTVGLSVTPGTNTLTPGQTQQLTATLTGATNTDVAWSTTAPGIAAVSSTGLVRAILPGSATIITTSAADPSKTVRTDITVSAGTTANLDVPLVYLTQSDQSTDGRIPMVANRATIARVFVRGYQSPQATVPVRLRIYNGATVTATLAGTATVVASTTTDQTCCSANITIPTALLRDGMTMSADVDPDNTIAESNKTDNAWPLTGVSKPIRVVTVPTVNIQLVPIRHRVSGVVGTANLELAALLQRMYPLATVNVTAHAEYATDTPAPSTGPTWIQMLREIDVLRTLENSSAYYFGVLAQQAAPGIVGIAGVGGFSEVGVGGPVTQASETLTHEFGHSFGRQHSPTPTRCGVPSGVDTNYPYADGTIGVFGFDLVTGTVYPPTSYDIMGYCNATWASDYTYTGVLQYLRSGAVPSGAVASTGTSPVLMIGGSLIDGNVSVDPVFTTTSAATAQQSAGRFVAEGLSIDGRVLFRHRFDGREVGDADPSARTFLIGVPYDASASGAVASITIKDASGSARAGTMLRTGTYVANASGVSLRVDGDPQLTATPSGANRFDITWNVARYPSIVVRERDTQRVVAIGRRGAITIPASSLTGLEVLLSDGVSSTTRALSAGGAP